MSKTKRGRTTPMEKLVGLSGLVTTAATVAVVTTVLTENDPATLVCAHILTTAVLTTLVLMLVHRTGRALRGLVKGPRR